MVEKLGYSRKFKEFIDTNQVIQLIGVYDVFSALIAAQQFEAIFCSGYGYTASHYGLPDEGYLTWTDTIDYCSRLRGRLPNAHLIMDVDDGFGNEVAAQTTVARLLSAGASAVILEDQVRPKKCGHLDGKDVVPLNDYLRKLDYVNSTGAYVIARTDSEDLAVALERVVDFEDTGADAVLVDGIRDTETIKKIRETIKDDTMLAVNFISGGKTPLLNVTELVRLGVNIAIYSTPCLFAAHQAIEEVVRYIKRNDGDLPESQLATFSKNRKTLKS